MTSNEYLQHFSSEFFYTDGYVKITTLRKFKQYLLCSKHDASVSIYSASHNRLLRFQFAALLFVAAAALFRTLERIHALP
jgi:hypothetical protein